jgi:hypothetical protein
MTDGTLSQSSTVALAELDRVERAVRLRSRWYARYLLALGAGTIAYYAAVDVAAPATPLTLTALALGWSGFMILLVRWMRAQPVTWRGIRRLRATLMTVYFGLVAATVTLNATVWHDLPGQWGLGIVPALPCLIGAWAVLRR